MVYIRQVNSNVEVKTLCVLVYRRVLVLPYLAAPVEKAAGLEA